MLGCERDFTSDNLLRVWTRPHPSELRQHSPFAIAAPIAVPGAAIGRSFANNIMYDTLSYRKQMSGMMILASYLTRTNS